jgi:hypothetical protein
LAWDLFQAAEWHFLRVDPLAEPEIRFYLAEAVEREKAQRTGVNWYEAVPDEGRHLLAIPRFVNLIAGILEREVSEAKAQQRDPRQAIESLDLRTEADVYRLAYFEPGEYVAPKNRIAGQDERLNRRGLIAQGLDVYLTLPNGRTQFLGLDEGEVPDESNYRERITSAANLLVAIAFEMYAHPDKHQSGDANRNKANNPLEPNTVGVPEDKLKAFRKDVEKRLRVSRREPFTSPPANKLQNLQSIV